MSWFYLFPLISGHHLSFSSDTRPSSPENCETGWLQLCSRFCYACYPYNFQSKSTETQTIKNTTQKNPKKT